MAQTGGYEGGAGGEGIFQQEEAWMTIEQKATIVHPFVLRHFVHNTASRCISQDGRSKKLYFVSSRTFISGSSSLNLLTMRDNFPAARPALIIKVFFG